ncbi:Protein FAM63A [Trichinella pseudospiralis]|uniref:Protein FAM63A n=1 Tax=Trichinella pseudospiralis TaxID=6337 RepID=A0A0V1JWQ6_TRIPS|nr:Protein FAM63A [Trichinella pseudospiralis]
MSMLLVWCSGTPEAEETESRQAKRLISVAISQAELPIPTTSTRLSSNPSGRRYSILCITLPWNSVIHQLGVVHEVGQVTSWREITVGKILNGQLAIGLKKKYGSRPGLPFGPVFHQSLGCTLKGWIFTLPNHYSAYSLLLCMMFIVVCVCFLINQALASTFDPAEFSIFQCQSHEALSIQGRGTGFVKLSCAKPVACSKTQNCKMTTFNATCSGANEYVHGIIKLPEHKINQICCQLADIPSSLTINERCFTDSITNQTLAEVQSALNEKERLPYSYLARDDYAPAFVKLFRLAHQSDGVRIVKKIKAVQHGYLITSCQLDCIDSTTLTNGSVPPEEDILCDETCKMLLEKNRENNAVTSVEVNPTSLPEVQLTGEPVIADNALADGKLEGRHATNLASSASSSGNSAPGQWQPCSYCGPFIPRAALNSAINPIPSATNPIGGGCFSADMHVRTTHSQIRMDQLQLDDIVFVDPVEQQPIFSMLHHDPVAEVDFIIIKTETNRSLSLTPNHLIPIVPCQRGILHAEKLEATVNRYSKFAHRAEQDQCVLMAYDGLVKTEKIVTISQRRLRGIFSPLTEKGTIVVNDFVVSCYSTCESHALQKLFHNSIRHVSRMLRNALFTVQPVSSTTTPLVDFTFDQIAEIYLKSLYKLMHWTILNNFGGNFSGCLFMSDSYISTSVSENETEVQSSQLATAVQDGAEEPDNLNPVEANVPAEEFQSQQSRTVADTQSEDFSAVDELIHHVKWIIWHGRSVPIITQNENGPCPLLAIVNLLFLRGRLTLPPGTELVTARQLMNQIGETFIQCGFNGNHRQDFEQNLFDAFSVLPKLSTGLDVNVKFSGVFDFEYTSECIVFDLLNIRLCHGWLPEPEDPEIMLAVSDLSYNQLVEKIVAQTSEDDSLSNVNAFFLQSFLEQSASQLSQNGLSSLLRELLEDELAVFFRNNHFSVITKHEGTLFLLLTDQGFLKETDYVWETLDTIDGDSQFVDTEFRLAKAKSEEKCLQDGGKQIENDFLLAMSLSEEGAGPYARVKEPVDDFHFAEQFQRKENEAVLHDSNDLTAGRNAAVENPVQGDNMLTSTTATPRVEKCRIL